MENGKGKKNCRSEHFESKRNKFRLQSCSGIKDTERKHLRHLTVPVCWRNRGPRCGITWKTWMLPFPEAQREKKPHDTHSTHGLLTETNVQSRRDIMAAFVWAAFHTTRRRTLWHKKKCGDEKFERHSSCSRQTE